MMSTAYFQDASRRPDRTNILEVWIMRVLAEPEASYTQADGRKRLWGRIPEAGGKWLRVVVLADGVTVHNAFFDRRFKGGLA